MRLSLVSTSGEVRICSAREKRLGITAFSISHVTGKILYYDGLASWLDSLHISIGPPYRLRLDRMTGTGWSKHQDTLLLSYLVADQDLHKVL